MREVINGKFMREYYLEKLKNVPQDDDFKLRTFLAFLKANLIFVSYISQIKTFAQLSRGKIRNYKHIIKNSLYWADTQEGCNYWKILNERWIDLYEYIFE